MQGLIQEYETIMLAILEETFQGVHEFQGLKVLYNSLDTRL